jgi:hypothetical protein
MGYHKVAIAKGVYGEPSKLLEEMEELKDALSQDKGETNKVLILCELTDIISAIRGYLTQHFAGKITLADLEHQATKNEENWSDRQRRHLV